jgi:hypothetical protein
VATTTAVPLWRAATVAIAVAVTVTVTVAVAVTVAPVIRVWATVTVLAITRLRLHRRDELGAARLRVSSPKAMGTLMEVTLWALTG